MMAEPRRVEVLLFLQYVSQPANYPGGLRKFTADLLAESQDLLGTERMRALGEKQLTPREAREIYEALPQSARDKLGGTHRAFDTIRCACEEFGELTGAERQEDESRFNEELMELFARIDWPVYRDLCARRAEEYLCDFLRALCEQPHVEFIGERSVWYFPEVVPAIIRFIDRREARLRGAIAETAVTKLVWKWLGKARNTGRAILISGNSRFGKTEALRTWCAGRAGVARLVNTPASNSESDLLREVAKALGLNLGPTTRASDLRERIDYVLSSTRLMLVFDEAHFIFPVNFSRNTAAGRLNWVRRSVMDAGLACAFVSTPQSYGSARKRFVRTTGYTIEQFEERLLKTIDLPEELSPEDLLAAAQIHFPRMDRDSLDYVVNIVAGAERNFMSDLEKIAALARDNAAEAGRTALRFDDIKAAIADVLPAAAKRPAMIAQGTAEPAAGASRKPALSRACAPAETPVHASFKRLARGPSAAKSTAPEAQVSRINFDLVPAESFPESAV